MWLETKSEANITSSTFQYNVAYTVRRERIQFKTSSSTSFMPFLVQSSWFLPLSTHGMPPPMPVPISFFSSVSLTVSFLSLSLLSLPFITRHTSALREAGPLLLSATVSCASPTRSSAATAPRYAPLSSRAVPAARAVAAIARSHGSSCSAALAVEVP